MFVFVTCLERQVKVAINPDLVAAVVPLNTGNSHVFRVFGSSEQLLATISETDAVAMTKGIECPDDQDSPFSEG